MRSLLIGLVAAALLWSVGYAADKPATAPPPTDPAVLQKLDQILANQDQLFKRLDVIDKELYIIKIRASRKD